MNDIDSHTEFFLSAQAIRKKFRIGNSIVEVLRGVTFGIPKGQWIALLGASGSGKTTLLDIIGTISQPDEGKIIIDGIQPETLSSGALVQFRRKVVGFVFQAYHMLPELNITENVMLPALLDGAPRSKVRDRALGLLEKVGLSHRVYHRANELSGGEQQRAAIARSLINNPKLLLADEPTGNLDSATGAGILELFQAIKKESDTTIIMVTHDKTIASLADSIIELHDGVISSADQA